MAQFNQLNLIHLMIHALCVAQYTWSSLKWHLPSGVGPTPPPLMAQIYIYFLPHFFSFAIESYIYETDFTLSVKNRTFTSSYNWYKYWHSSAAPAGDCQLLVDWAIFTVTSTKIFNFHYSTWQEYFPYEFCTSLHPLAEYGVIIVD